MSKTRRALCLILGAPLAGAGLYLGWEHLLNADLIRTRIILAAFLLLFGGAALLKSALTGR